MKHLVCVLESNFEILENRNKVAEKLPCKGECVNKDQCSNPKHCYAIISIGAALNSNTSTLVTEIPLTSGTDLILGAETIPLIK